VHDFQAYVPLLPQTSEPDEFSLILGIAHFGLPPPDKLICSATLLQLSRVQPMSTLRWFAIRTKPRHEKAVSLTLLGKGYEQFLPVYSSRALGSNRKPASLPLFAGYLFCRFDVEDRLPILVTPGVFNIVGCGRAPIALDDSEIADLQSVVRAGIALQPWPFLKVGHRVRIKCGALEGVEGVLVKSKSVDRLIVSITLLQRSVAVEIDSGSVEPVSAWSRPGWTAARAGAAAGVRGYAIGR